MNSAAMFIDHTLLRGDTTGADIELLCEEAVEYGFAAVCIPPSCVAPAGASRIGTSAGVAIMQQWQQLPCR